MNAAKTYNETNRNVFLPLWMRSTGDKIEFIP